MDCQFAFRLEPNIASLLQDNIRELSKGRYDREVDLEKIGPIRRRYDSRMDERVPVPPERVKEQGRALRDWREFDFGERAWWHQRWPYAPPVVSEEVAEMSVQSDERSERPLPARPQRCALVCRAEGTISPARAIIQQELEVEELQEISRRQQLEVLQELVGTGIAFPKPDDDFLRQNILGRPITYIINTREYYPLVPDDYMEAKHDLRFARCVYSMAVEPCPRGALCPFVHSKARPRENFRRSVLKIIARVRWACGKGRPQWPPKAPQLLLPEVEPWLWEDRQDPYMPQWVMARPEGADPLGYVLSLAREIEKAPHIQRFELRKCALTTDTLTVLYKALRTIRCLRELSLRYCDITDETAVVLVEYLEANQTLNTLNLGFNNIGPAGVDALVTGIIACPGLKKFSLHGNMVGDQGTHHLCRLLQVHENLEVLSVACTMVGDESFQLLGRALVNNATLKSLTLDGTNPSLAGCMMLYNSVKVNRTIRELSLRCVKATTAMFLRNVQEILDRNSKKSIRDPRAPHQAGKTRGFDELAFNYESDDIGSTPVSDLGSTAGEGSPSFLQQVSRPQRWRRPSAHSTPRHPASPTSPATPTLSRRKWHSPRTPRSPPEAHRAESGSNAGTPLASPKGGRRQVPRLSMSGSSMRERMGSSVRGRPIAPNQTVATNTLGGGQSQRSSGAGADDVELFGFGGGARGSLGKTGGPRHAGRALGSLSFGRLAGDGGDNVPGSHRSSGPPAPPESPPRSQSRSRVSLSERRVRAAQNLHVGTQKPTASPLVEQLSGRLDSVMKKQRQGKEGSW